MLLTPLYPILYVVIISFLLQNGLWDEFLSSMNNELPWGNIHVHIKVIVHYTRKLKKYPNFVLNFRVVRFKSSDLYQGLKLKRAMEAIAP